MPDKVSALAVAAAGLVALAVAMGIGRFLYTPILPMMLDEHLLTLADGAWLASANYVGHLAGATVAIFVQVQARRMLVLSLAAICVATLAMGWTQALPLWFALRFVAGFFGALGLIYASTVCLAQLGRLGRPGYAGWVYAGVGAGIMAAGAAGYFFLRSDASAADAWRAMGGMAVVATLWAAWVLLRLPASAAASAVSQAAPHLRLMDAGPARLIVCYGVYGFGYIVPATFVPVMARQAVADPQVFALAWPLFGAAALLSTLLAASLHRRFSYRRIWATSQLVLSGGLLAPVLHAGFGSVIVAALCVGGTFMVITMVAMQQARACAGAGAGKLIAAMTAAFGIGQIVGPTLIALLPSAGGNPMLVPLCVAAFATAAATLLLIPRP